MSDNIVHIDGSMLEGGGQILRIALTLSALCKIPIHVNNIRAGRSKPGLMAQHLKGIHLIRDITHGKLEGDSLGSTEIKFWPNKITSGDYRADTRTAGSVTLLMQVGLPCILFSNAPTSLTLCGGTNTEMAPQVDYMTEIFRPNLEKFGATFDFDLVKRGYFPKGGGVIKVYVNPIKSLNNISLIDQGQIKSILGWSFVAGNLPMHIAQNSADSAVRVFRQYFPDITVNIERYKEDYNIARDNCSGLILVGETTTGCTLGSSILGQKNLQADEAGKRSATELSEVLKSGACVDQHCQDQLIVFMALANGKSQIRVDKVTMHTETAIFVTEKLTKAKFEITQDGQTHIISCTGIGFQNTNL